MLYDVPTSFFSSGTNRHHIDSSISEYTLCNSGGKNNLEQENSLISNKLPEAFPLFFLEVLRNCFLIRLFREILLTLSFPSVHFVDLQAVQDLVFVCYIVTLSLHEIRVHKITGI